MARKDQEQDDEIRQDEPATSEPSENDENTPVIISETEALQNKFAEVQDKYLRLSAEFDNFRKRTLREKIDLMQTAGESLIKDLLPVVDDFERGLEVIDKSEDIIAVKTGMELIYSKLKDFLTAHNVNELDALNEPFDADKHEAITNIPAPSPEMKGKVVDVIQKGYVLQDKIIRYPKVVVGE
jgi:molecular chaperone GrpE